MNCHASRGRRAEHTSDAWFHSPKPGRLSIIMTTEHDAPAAAGAPLSERELAILQFEATWFTLDEDRHDAIRARFACSVEEYNLEVNRVIDHPAALLADQLVVRRLRRHRDRRRRALIDGAAAGEQA
jgi:hypothetical protein